MRSTSRGRPRYSRVQCTLDRPCCLPAEECRENSATLFYDQSVKLSSCVRNKFRDIVGVANGAVSRRTASSGRHAADAALGR